MRGAKRTIWLKIGAWPAFCAALLPVLVALFHLIPAIAAAPALPEHHEHAAPGKIAALQDDDCHSPGEARDDLPQNAGAHCPLCLWLQGFHALPAPLAAGLRMPATRAVVVPRHEPSAEHSAFYLSSQPRAPPISPAA